MKRYRQHYCRACGTIPLNDIFEIEPNDCILWNSVLVKPGDFMCCECVERAEAYWIHCTTRMEELIKGVGYKWCSERVEELFKQKMSQQSKDHPT